MIKQLNYEKKAAYKNFAVREKQIWGVQENINVLFGSIKGIAANSLSTSTILDLPDAEIDD